MDRRAKPVEEHVYIDETKARRYIVVAAHVALADAETYRELLRELALPGERAIHMKRERRSRRHRIAAAIARSEVETMVYDAGALGTEQARRRACLQAIVQTSTARPTHLVLDRDDSLVSWDRQVLIELTRSAPRASITYAHGKADERDPLLAIPDVIAWCWAKGGEWRALVKPIVRGVQHLNP